MGRRAEESAAIPVHQKMMQLVLAQAFQPASQGVAAGEAQEKMKTAETMHQKQQQQRAWQVY